MAFIPTAVLSGRSKSLSDPPLLEDFMIDSNTISFKNGDKYFMNHLDMEAWSEKIQYEFESISCVFIEDFEGDTLIIENNLFERNIGTTGGALRLSVGSNDSNFWQIRNNTFLSNIAYFEGNAIFV